MRTLHDSNNSVSGHSWVVQKTATYIITGNLVGNATTPSLYVYRNGSVILGPSGTGTLAGNFYTFIDGTEITLNQNDSITFGRNSVGSVSIFEKNNI